MKTWFFISLGAAAAAACCGFAAPAYADTVYWTGPDGGQFGVASNWDGGAVPDMSSDALIATSTDRDVIGPGDALSVYSLVVGGAAGTNTLYLVQDGQLAAAAGTQLLDHGRLAMDSGTDAVFATSWLGGSLVTYSGSAMVFKAGSVQAGYDRLVIDGPLFVQGGSFVLSFDGVPQLHVGDRYDFIDWTNPVRPQGAAGMTVGSFDALMLPALDAGLVWDTSSFYVDGSLAVAAVPEPAAFGLMATGLLGLGWRVRRERRALATSTAKR